MCVRWCAQEKMCCMCFELMVRVGLEVLAGWCWLGGVSGCCSSRERWGTQRDRGSNEQDAASVTDSGVKV